MTSLRRFKIPHIRSCSKLRTQWIHIDCPTSGRLGTISFVQENLKRLMYEKCVLWQMPSFCSRRHRGIGRHLDSKSYRSYRMVARFTLHRHYVSKVGLTFGDHICGQA
ncbi:hypothetical protein ARMSODRAFT_161897 [Armillaria solidipes]|uniref:Uncharacterized protein n=1 Tax=Armillaria solidipes TaxID=1076256 RepID=A0A2H3BEX6_9AGAR|nr:hypothetical protein ARMSODRAFT_161897 [Armillaria solidipes]